MVTAAVRIVLSIAVAVDTTVIDAVAVALAKSSPSSPQKQDTPDNETTMSKI
jgi:hypothetical protein